MENVAVIILGIIVALLPGGGGDAARNSAEEILMKKLDVGAAQVYVVNEKSKQNIWSAGAVKVVLENWKTDSGEASTATMIFNDIGALKEDGSWKLDDVKTVGIEIILNAENLWEAAAMSVGGVQLTGLELKKNNIISIEGNYPFYMGLPVRFELSGEPVVKNGTQLTIGRVKESKIMGFNLGAWGENFIMSALNPLLDFEEWDVVSAFTEEYLDIVGRRRFSLVVRSIELESDVVKIKAKFMTGQGGRGKSGP